MSDPSNPLVERERELADLEELLADTGEGRGRVALIQGPAGIGKSALLERARARGTDQGLTVLWARGGELERYFGFGVVRQLFEPVLTGAGPDERTELMSGAASLAAPVFATSAGNGGAGEESPDAVVHGLYWLLVNLSESSPVLLAIDDAHWADAPSLRYLVYLARRLEGLQAAIALGIRSGDPGEAELLRRLEVEARPLAIQPTPLSEAGVQAVVEAILNGCTSAETCRICHEATGGNPFLLTALLEELRREGRRSDEIGPAAVGGLASERVATYVLMRVGRLGDATLLLARAIAVLGERASLSEAAALAGLELSDASSAADALTRATVLERGPPLRFVHPLVRTAIYEDIPDGARAALHARAAQVLDEAGAEPESISLHLLATEPATDPTVVEGLRDAARAALSRGAPETASRYLRRALLEPPTDAERASLALALGVAAARAGEPDALERMGQAFELAPGPRVRATAALELGPALMYVGRADEAVDVLERGLAGLDDAELATTLEALLLLTGLTTASARRRVQDRLLEARTRVEELPVARIRPLLAPIALDIAITGGTAAKAAKLAERALAGGALIRGRMADSPLAYVAAFTLARAGRAEVAERAMADAAAEARSRGSISWLAFALAFGAFAHLRVGSLVAAEADARAAIDLAAEAGLAIALSNAAAAAVEALVERDDHAGAHEVLERAEAGAQEPETLPSLPLRGSRARLLLAEGDPEGALAELTACARWEQECGTGTVVPVAWRSEAVPAHLALGQEDEARRLAHEEVEIARRFGAARPLGVALRAAGLAEGGGRGIELLEEAVTALAGAEDRLEHARALVDLGAAVRREGQRVEAREKLGAGMDLAERCGATALVEQAHEELLVAGARPRRTALSGRASLTASELRVSEMAAKGMSNPEIAQALFVTLRTVEMHLSNAYRKLEISSRRELAAALDQPREP